MEELHLLKFGWDNYVIIEPTHNTMDCDYKAYIRDGVGLGVGNTVEEAIASVVSSLRRTADIIEQESAKRNQGN